MTAGAPQKPKWEYGGTFSAAWDGIGEAALASDDYQLDDEQRRLLREGMANAHVVTIERAQLDAIPQIPHPHECAELSGAVPQLPFPTLYISVSSRHREPWSYDCRLAGLLVEINNGLSIATFWRLGSDNRQLIVPAVLCSFKLRTFVYAWQGLGAEAAKDPEEGEKVDNVIAGSDIERALAVIGFLESANVELDETPVTRQVRRNARRHGTPIASRVYVRPPKHRRDGGGVGDRIEFSHRFEVRGHYKHYGPDTRLFQATERDKPGKVLEHPTRGPVVRVWCPAYVKGPEDKPLVPKVRVITEVA